MRKMILAFLLAISFTGFANTFTPPDEGMWLPMFVERLNYTDMEEMGLQLTAEEIYSINNSSLKDAIVGLSGGGANGFFCTAEVVSDKGLIFTNHHCGYNFIQEHSTTKNNILRDGFWAYEMDQELPNEGLSASFLIRMDNVTDSIIPQLSDTMTEPQRSSKVKGIIGKLKNQASEDGKYNVVVKPFYGGNEYYLFVYKTYDDVRLVGTPPESIGKFGGDTDNWMWPRHTGDFSIFRIYSGPEGEPAKYAEENIPLKPKHHLPVSIKGVEEGDFAMIWGYPGGTDRYLTSYGINYNMNFFYPIIVEIFGEKLAIWGEDMDVDEDIDLDYSAKYAGIANAWKLFIGMQRGIKNLDVYDRKKEIEEKFTGWVDQKSTREEKYGEALQKIQEGYEEMGEYFKPLLYTNLAGFGGAEILAYAQNFNQLAALMEDKKQRKKNEEIINETAQQLADAAAEHFDQYSAKTDQKVMAAMIKLYLENVSPEFWPEFAFEVNDDYEGKYKEYAADVFDESIFVSEERVKEFLEKPKYKKLEKDPAFIAMKGFFGKMMELGGKYQQSQQTVNQGNRLFIAGLREMNPDKVYYPNANSTMRLTYGTVEDYFPADAVHYDFYTTLEGVMEKEDPTDDEFIVPEKLKEIYENKDYGPYDQNGEMVTCFLTTTDITGGNSGSPVINAHGELIGIAFDGNWEAMSGDIAFEPELQRTINVDIRYVLLIIDKFAGAQNLIDEMTIVKKKPLAPKADVEVAEEDAKMEAVSGE